MIEAKPYKLVSYIQNYEWGTVGDSAFIPKFIGEKVREVPYAELWIGAHPKLSSDIIIDNKLLKLNDLINKYGKEILGESILKKFGNTLPFLLKVLSARKALSIQTHPDKEEARKFHKEDSQNYPDDNHKPEIAIAIDSLKALVGFKPINELIATLNKFPEIKDFLGIDAIEMLIYNKNGLQEVLKILFERADNSASLSKTINMIKKRIENNFDKTDDEKEFLELFKQYGYDVGVVVFFFLNFVKLSPDEAIFTPHGVPHAYLKGNIIECMANSDNVIRAGLTPKFKDVNRLLNILDYKAEKPEIIGEKSSENIVRYNIPVNEFFVEKIVLSDNEISLSTKNKVEVLLVMEGEIMISDKIYQKGDSVLIPALLSGYKIFSNRSVFVRVTVPE